MTNSDSGYMNCACRDCIGVGFGKYHEHFEVFCSDCEDAGCESNSECQRTNTDEDNE